MLESLEVKSLDGATAVIEYKGKQVKIETEKGDKVILDQNLTRIN